MKYFFPSLIAIVDMGRILLLFPVWWYTQGLRERWQSAWRELHDCKKLFHLRILIRHLFTPLYGYKDWETKFVSVIVRAGHLLCFAFVTLGYTVYFLGGFFLWTIVPVFVLWNIGYQVGLLHVSLYEPFLSLLRFLMIA